MPNVTGVVSMLSLLTVDAAAAGQVNVFVSNEGNISGGLWFSVEDDDGGSEETRTMLSCEAPSPLSDDGGGDTQYDSSTFYTTAVEWTEDRFRWYIEGIQYCQVTMEDVLDQGGSWAYNQEMYISLGAAVGRDTSGISTTVNSSWLPVSLDVEYVRVYQFADMDGTPVQESATRYVREGTLAWQDEFDGVELDEASAKEAGEGVMGLEYWWQHEEGDGCEMGICGFGNGEAQWYRKENAGVMDGKLRITAKAEAYAGNIYTSAKMSTDSTVVMKYGRIETSVKLPKAVGIWPSIWLLPQDSPYGSWASGGAIDVLQARNLMDRIHGQLVFGGEYPDVDNLDLYEGGHCYSDLYDDFSEDYHVYALEWEEDVFRWYVDDVLYCERTYWYSREGPGTEDYAFPAPFDTGFYLIMNVAVGGTFTGGLIDEDALESEQQMLVDYIRIYNFENQSVLVADPPEVDDGSAEAPSLEVVVSILGVLGALLLMCMGIGCVAKARSRRSHRNLMEEDSLDPANSAISPIAQVANKVHHPSLGKYESYSTPGSTDLRGPIQSSTETHGTTSDTPLTGKESWTTALPSLVNAPLHRPDRDGGHEISHGNSSSHFPVRQPRPPSGTVPIGWVVNGGVVRGCEEGAAPSDEPGVVENVLADLNAKNNDDRIGAGGVTPGTPDSSGSHIHSTARDNHSSVVSWGSEQLPAEGNQGEFEAGVMSDRSGLSRGRNTLPSYHVNSGISCHIPEDGSDDRDGVMTDSALSDAAGEDDDYLPPGMEPMRVTHFKEPEVSKRRSSEDGFPSPVPSVAIKF